MHHSRNLLLSFALLALVTFGCSKVENILPKNDGLWRTVSSSIEVNYGGLKFNTLVPTADLGKIYFDEDGTGYNENASGAKTGTFTWATTGDASITITDDSTKLPIVWSILESKRNDQTWSTSASVSDPLLGTVSTVVTNVMERVE